MFESFRMPSCVSRRLARRPVFVIVHTLLSLMICLSLACTARRDASAPCPVIEMSPLADTQTNSGKAVTLNDTTTLQISRTPLVTTGDIVSASASQTDNQWRINLTVTDDVAKRVHDFTKQHVGRNLVLVVDGKAHGTPRIASAVVGNSYQIDGLNRANAERLAAAISNGCRR